MQSSSRNGAKVIWLTVHTTEGIMRAKDLRDWKAWAGSSHAANDETGVLMTPRDGFVSYDRAAWTLRNGNPISENIEQCGWARWTRAEWLARPKLLETTALWLADRSRARGIPLRLLTPAEIRGRKTPGVLGHGHYSTATGDGTHWDPGPNYPWDVVLEKANWLLKPTVLPARPAPVIAKPVAPPSSSEEFDMLVEIEPGETSKIPVPTGRTYRINVVSDSVFGQQVYGKQVSPGRVVGLFFGHAFGTGEKEWELFVAETHNIEIPCAATSFVEITNKGVPQKPENSRPIAVTLTPVP